MNNIFIHKRSELHSPHTVMVCMCKVLYMQHPISHTYTFWAPAVSVAQETHIFTWPRNSRNELERKIFISRWGGVPTFQSAILFPITPATLSCHPQLQAGTKCTVHYTYTQSQCICTHKPLLALSPLCVDCIRKCSQA